MTDKAEIDKAIGAHGMWKSKLRQVISTGTSDTPVATIRMDNQCNFGKWLYGATLSATDKSSAHYKSVKDLHAQFHRTAGQVTELALAGKKSEAENLISMSGEFSIVSAKLTEAMLAWKKSLG